MIPNKQGHKMTLGSPDSSMSSDLRLTVIELPALLFVPVTIIKKSVVPLKDWENVYYINIAWCYRVFPPVDQSSPAFSGFPVNTLAQDWGRVQFDSFPQPLIHLLLRWILHFEDNMLAAHLFCLSGTPFYYLSQLLPAIQAPLASIPNLQLMKIIVPAGF